MGTEINDEPTGPHTWSQAFESIGCGLIVAAFLLAVLGICTWGLIAAGRR
jgi:hypothetical protein